MTVGARRVDWHCDVAAGWMGDKSGWMDEIDPNSNFHFLFICSGVFMPPFHVAMWP